MTPSTPSFPNNITKKMSVRRRPLSLSTTHISKLPSKGPNVWTWLQGVEDYEDWATSTEALELAIAFEDTFKQQQEERTTTTTATSKPDNITPSWGSLIRALSVRPTVATLQQDVTSLKGSIRSSLTRTNSRLKTMMDKLSTKETFHKRSVDDGGSVRGDVPSLHGSGITLSDKTQTDRRSRQDQYFGNALLGDQQTGEKEWPKWDDDAVLMEEGDLCKRSDRHSNWMLIV
ncbi:hypothetical protein QBC41DRAFT_379166 [Cercophora samala]|uniref:Uncharacterized protein n=1 Tax=Cercophora samala TaxID=330535 RepID=A0AA40D9K2_9PEZI|nr:hypothetical protein QBC41DRAFT_379166 [Cercophora samala]